LRAFGRSDTGRVRSSNQDAFICGRLPGGAVFAVVSDGMGGANGGNVASAIAIKVISDRIVDVYREGMGQNSLRHMLESAISAANVEIFDAAMADTDLRGMGTTVVSVLVVDGQVHIAHVGDSRAYIVVGEGMEQVTRDHSIVQTMVEKGQLTPDEARNHPRKHFITRALGVEETVECDYNEFPFPREGLLLICTDGLTNMVETDEIYKTVKTSVVDDIPDRLIGAANMAGGSDNITVVVLSAS
jgi:serine/threonine protein phosphatase PrpC